MSDRIGMPAGDHEVLTGEDARRLLASRDNVATPEEIERRRAISRRRLANPTQEPVPGSIDRARRLVEAQRRYGTCDRCGEPIQQDPGDKFPRTVEDLNADCSAAREDPEAEHDLVSGAVSLIDNLHRFKDPA